MKRLLCLSIAVPIALILAIFAPAMARTEAVSVSDLIWTWEVVDSGGFTGQNSSLAVDANGNPHIAFYDYGDIRYASWTGSYWVLETVEADDAGSWLSLKLDGDGRPHLSYNDYNTHDLKYATKTEAGWQIQTVDDRGWPPLEPGGPRTTVGLGASLALDSAGRPHIAYTISAYTVADFPLLGLWYASLTDDGWELQQVAQGYDEQYVSLAIDSHDRPHIVSSSNGPLHYSFRSDSGWLSGAIDDTRARTNSLAIDSKDQLHIAYVRYYNSATDLMYKHYNGQAWITERVEQVGADSNGSKNWIALDPEDVPHIAYDGWVSPPSNYSSALKIKGRTALGWATEMQKIGNSIDISFVIDAANHSHVSYNTETSVSDYVLYYGRQLDPSTPTPTSTSTWTSTATASPSLTPTVTWTPTVTPTETPTVTPTTTATATMTWSPSPTITPTETPTASITPTTKPTDAPTDVPTPSTTPISMTRRLYLPLVIR